MNTNNPLGLHSSEARYGCGAGIELPTRAAPWRLMLPPCDVPVCVQSTDNVCPEDAARYVSV